MIEWTEVSGDNHTEHAALYKNQSGMNVVVGGAIKFKAVKYWELWVSDDIAPGPHELMETMRFPSFQHAQDYFMKDIPSILLKARMKGKL